MIAILSDIHANLPALRAVLREVQSSGATQIAVLGDIIGYGASPAECVDWCRRLQVSAVIGNHDLEITNIRKTGSRYFPAGWEKSGYLAGLVHAAKALSPEQAAWLAALPYAKPIRGAVIAHASLDDPEAFGYIVTYDDALPSLQLLAAQEHKVGFFGHTHEQEVFHHPSTRLDWDSPTAFTIPADQPCVIMAGSVGQPRSAADRRACWVLWDPETRRVELRKTDYPRHQAAQDIAQAGLPAESALRLLSPGEVSAVIKK